MIKNVLFMAAGSRRGAILFCLFLFLLLAGLPVYAQEPLPPTSPDANNGLGIFAERCANCHGITGAGDGEMSDRLPKPPRDFSDPDYRKTAVPADMYVTVTNGRLEAGMPPFGPESSNPIPEANRWDAIAAVYSLSTPVEALERGAEVYAAECQSCHGDLGAGDGPEAGSQETPPTDLTDFDYWYNRSNAAVFASLQDETVVGHSYDLSDEQLWDVVDYSRAFSYVYFDTEAPAAVLETAVISGNVTNGSTGEIVPEGTAVLRAFTPEFNEAMTLNADVNSDGVYTFELTSVPSDWVYLISVEYGDFNYNSPPAGFEAGNPVLNLPITVYETTTDSDFVNLEQVHVILDIQDDRLFVNEVYVFNNDADAVFVGSSGSADEGTIELVLPTGAENVAFQRAIGSAESFFPATEMIQTDRGWADTVPLRPGANAMTLLANYELPYESGMTIAHPVFYETASARVMLPDVGVELDGGEWAAQESQSMGPAGSFLIYLRPGLGAGDAVSFNLDGRPQQRVVDANGSSLLVRDETTEMIIGALVLMVVVAAALLMIRSWQQTAVATAVAYPPDVGNYLKTIARLDDAYENGQIDTESYTLQREILLFDLAAIW